MLIGNSCRQQYFISSAASLIVVKVAGRPVETRKALTRFQIETATKRRENQARRGIHDRDRRHHHGPHPYGRPHDDHHDQGSKSEAKTPRLGRLRLEIFFSAKVREVKAGENLLSKVRLG